MLTWPPKLTDTIRNVFGSSTKTLFRRGETCLEADYLCLKNGMLTFVSAQPPTSPKVRLELNTGEGRRVLEEVRLRSQRRTESGEFVCQAHWPGELSAARVPESAEHLRREPRSGRRLRVLSAELPSFLALTHDISRSGLSLDLKAPVKPGSELKLQIELDMPGQPPLEARARVAWCQGTRAGLAFLNLNGDQVELLERYESWMNGTYLKPAKTPLWNLSAEKVAPEEPKPPAGHLQNLRATEGLLEIELLRASGSRYALTFEEVRLLRDQRGLYGSGFDDAVEDHHSDLSREVRLAQPINLEERISSYHYQFLNRAEKVVLEVVCLKPVASLKLA